MNIAIIGCSHSCGLNLYYKYKKDVYDHNKGWVFELADMYPQHNFYNFSSPGTGFNIHNNILDQIILKSNIDLIIVQLTSPRYIIPLENYEQKKLDSDLTNLTQYQYPLKQSISLILRYKSAINQHVLEILNEDENVVENLLDLYKSFLSRINVKYLMDEYNIYLQKIVQLQTQKKVAIIDWGGTETSILQQHGIFDESAISFLIKHIVHKYKLTNIKQAYALYNKMANPHMNHMTEEWQKLILYQYILNHHLISEFL